MVRDSNPRWWQEISLPLGNSDRYWGPLSILYNGYRGYRDVALTTHAHLVPRFRLGKTTPLLSLFLSMCLHGITGRTLPLLSCLYWFQQYVSKVCDWYEEVFKVIREPGKEEKGTTLSDTQTTWLSFMLTTTAMMATTSMRTTTTTTTTTTNDARWEIVNVLLNAAVSIAARCLRTAGVLRQVF
jgi:hypothetical protein